MNAPNFISFSRLLLVPLIVWLLLRGHYFFAFWTFVAAGLSDAVDGFLARRMNSQSVIGGFLDPLADKALLMSVYVTLGYQGMIATWLVILVVFRDLVIIGGALLFQTLNGPLRPHPLMISKINTAAQIVLAALVLGGLAFEMRQMGIERILSFIVGGTTLLSGAAYVIKWGRHASAMETKP